MWKITNIFHSVIFGNLSQKIKYLTKYFLVFFLHSSKSVEMNKKHLNIFNSVKSIYWISKILNLAPYHFDSKSLNLSTKLWNYFEFLFSVFIWIVLTFYQWKNFHEYTIRSGVQSTLLDQLWQYQYLLQHVFAIFVIIYNFIKRHHVQRFLMILFNYDQRIQRLDWRLKISHSSNLITYFLSATLGSIVMYQIFSYLSGNYVKFSVDKFTLLRVIDYVFVTGLFLMISMQFILSTFCIFIRLFALRRNIRLDFPSIFLEAQMFRIVLLFKFSFAAHWKWSCRCSFTFSKGKIHH